MAGTTGVGVAGELSTALAGGGVPGARLEFARRGWIKATGAAAGGEMGATRATGAIGAGATGAMGATGATGATGTTGATGADWATVGALGLAGGSAGATGETFGRAGATDGIGATEACLMVGDRSAASSMLIKPPIADAVGCSGEAGEAVRRPSEERSRSAAW